MVVSRDGKSNPCSPVFLPPGFHMRVQMPFPFLFLITIPPGTGKKARSYEAGSHYLHIQIYWCFPGVGLEIGVVGNPSES